MKVGIITPYFREPLDMLRTCHQSVRSQTHGCVHFMVADGFPREELSNWTIQHIVLPNSHDDAGNTPRAIGSLSALNQGFDAVAYLDADNWYYANHIESMIKLHRQTGAAVCTSSRTIHRLDGSLLYADKECDGRRHVDTSCYFFTRRAFRVLPTWAMMPRELGPVCDRIMWDVIRALGLSCAHHPEPTVAFRTQYDVHYRAVGEALPPGTKTVEQSTTKAMQWWSALSQEARADWFHRMGLQ